MESWTCDEGSLRSAGSSLREPAGRACHVFVSHAGEQKRDFVDIMYNEFHRRFPDVAVFLDETCLKVTEMAANSMHAALQDSFVGTCWLDCSVLGRALARAALLPLGLQRNVSPTAV
jgi:creatinine amidohydrolase/Fe(II)-dependent formamide hydrolase-like protein